MVRGVSGDTILGTGSFELVYLRVKRVYLRPNRLVFPRV